MEFVAMMFVYPYPLLLFSSLDVSSIYHFPPLFSLCFEDAGVSGEVLAAEQRAKDEWRSSGVLDEYKRVK
jgi:hypothetical protein